MKHKRLNRDAWGFQYYPYYQMRIDHELFHGLACLIRFTDGEKNYWQMPAAGKVQVTGGGMAWLELIPDDTRRVITVFYFPDGTHEESRSRYPVPANPLYQPSLWYIDVIEGTEQDEDGVAVFVDQYLDVIMSPEGDIKIDDRDELDAAYASGELSKAQYDRALAECGQILHEYGEDIRKTDAWCAAIRQLVEDRIAQGEPITISREVRELNHL
jgi:predicted RNA-binding protein associated with RNAse of E/G family